MKFCPVGTELFRANGRTDMVKLAVAVRSCTKAPVRVYVVGQDSAMKPVVRNENV